VLTGFAFALGGSFGTPGIVVGLVLFALGLGLLALSLFTLGRALTPLPRPKASVDLVEHGVYRFARHPVYGAIVLAALGWSIAYAPWGIPPALGLAVLLELKSRREEAWLVDHYAGYAAYRSRTPRRLLPFVY
jgi:protein-S-isoprenylcysteine O-methyltransferase Ste14